MGKTPYQEKLLVALDRAIFERAVAVEAKVQAMLMAVEAGWYHHLPGLFLSLPDAFATLLGPPPESRDADQ